MSQALLPLNSTLWERVMADVLDDRAALTTPAERIRSAKRVNPGVTFAPFLIHEYGLGELTPFVPNQYDLIRYGIGWQRVRGTPAAVRLGLGWVGLEALLEEAPSSRTFWNAFQLHFSTLPARDEPDLDRIENIVSLSVPLRSKLRRATHGYDVRALETDRGRLDGTRLDGDSGVRHGAGETLWSFGRLTEIDHQLTKAEGLAAGYWIEPNWDLPPEEGLRWQDLTIPWTQATFPWALDQRSQRMAAMVAWFTGKQLYVRFAGADGVIGYRRARFAWPVARQFGSAYRFGADSYGLTSLPQRLLVEALTDFHEAPGTLVTEIAVIVDAGRAQGVPAGKLWLGPNDLVGGVALGATAVSLPMRATVRERTRFMLRFDLDPPPPAAP